MLEKLLSEFHADSHASQSGELTKVSGTRWSLKTCSTLEPWKAWSCSHAAHVIHQLEHFLAERVDPVLFSTWMKNWPSMTFDVMTQWNSGNRTVPFAI